jgi:transcriptional regulator GlxA family with amidase domain
MAGCDRWTSLRRPGRGADDDDVPAGPDTVAASVIAVASDPADDHSLEAMARRAHVSPRHLARLFMRHLHCSPSEFVERVRVAVACRLLARTDRPISMVAVDVGFGSRETMRRAFLRVRGVPPGVYRRDMRRSDAAAMAGSEGSPSLP